MPNPACFHAQQATEKYLKGFLSFQGEDTPKVHSLISLLDLCISIDKEFEELKEDIIFLNTFYVETRYPGDYPLFSKKEAREAYEAALRVRDLCWRK